MLIKKIDSTTSTNSFASELANEIDGDFAVMAREQTAGRGAARQQLGVSTRQECNLVNIASPKWWNNPYGAVRVIAMRFNRRCGNRAPLHRR